MISLEYARSHVLPLGVLARQELARCDRDREATGREHPGDCLFYGRPLRVNHRLKSSNIVGTVVPWSASSCVRASSNVDWGLFNRATWKADPNWSARNFIASAPPLYTLEVPKGQQ